MLEPAFIEAANIALRVLERVLAGFLGDALGRQKRARERQELVLAINEGLRQEITDLRGSVDAVHIAVRELDLIVAGNPHLAWKNDQLVLDLDEATSPLEDLERSIAVRRTELGLPLADEHSDIPAGAQSARGSAAGDGFVAAPSLEPFPVVIANDDPQHRWRDAIARLPSEVTRERQQRARDDA